MFVGQVRRECSGSLREPSLDRGAVHDYVGEPTLAHRAIHDDNVCPTIFGRQVSIRLQSDFGGRQ